MGFLDQTATQKRMPVTVLLPGFQATCTLVSVGLIQTFINEETREIFPLDDVTLFGLEVGNPARSIRLSELYARKDHCHVLAFPEMLSREESGLMPHAEPLAVYTSHYVIQGNFHMGPETRVADFVDVVKTVFVGATDVAIFPLFEAQAALIQQAPLVYVARHAVRMHHGI